VSLPTENCRPAQPRDRAAALAATINAIIMQVATALLHREPVCLPDVRAAVENILRDEIDDIRREAAGERIEGLD